ncbi:hypothetical protein FYK55_09840 [Roseiconus nitratireducens]|uniref:Uncharacterized protein n=1 Tax=Roseiconus nitratireducens TaxID=2605748 RepID=A0A5M6DH73_9BACT|nr:hypothetical protein [Roseiconus nitratireducens]KAA5544605.1 hypothetical protein FYK55_09840 [Roseiconus nitratireducens]
MTEPTESQVDEELGLNAEMLDEWEAELNQFAAEIKQRLSRLSVHSMDPNPIQNSGLADPSDGWHG